MFDDKKNKRNRLSCGNDITVVFSEVKHRITEVVSKQLN